MARVSVIMGIYNCAETLPEALDSLLGQTYTDWIAILCNDGSTDQTYEVAKEYASKYPGKFELLNNEHNLGLNETLNRCLSVADTELIARMDGDDVSLPRRLEQEILFLDSHPELDIVSCNMIYFDEAGEWGRSNIMPFPVPKDFIYGTLFCHAPCVVRKEAYDAVGGYSVDKRYLRVEDYHLWLKMYEKGYRGGNLKEPLYMMRDDRNATRRRKYSYRVNEFRVHCEAVHKLKLPFVGYIMALRPLIVGLLPLSVYTFLHKSRMNKQ